MTAREFGKNICGIDMKILIKLTIFLAVAAIFANAAKGNPTLPFFEDYQEPLVNLQSHVKPKILSSQDRKFKTKIVDASKKPVNFAGHYVFSSFGCGASCLQSFAMDKQTGKVSWLPFTVCCGEPESEPIAVRKNSRLVAITGSRNEQGSGIYYYEFKHGDFVLIQAIER